MIRPARLEDREAILRLIVEMGGHEQVALRADPLLAFREVLADSQARALVAERDGEIVGYVEVRARASSVDDRREAWLGVLCVDEASRGAGIGAALVQAADREAALLGCSAVVLETAASRSEAHAFYRAQGFGEKPPARRFVREVRVAGGSLEQRFLAAAALAASAVRAAITGLGACAPVGIGADGNATEAADAAAEAAILPVLTPLGLPIVSEEAGLVGAGAVEPDRPWICLDPLDGSRNFVAGCAPYAVSIGLVCEGRPLAGFVADLDAGHRWWAIAGGGAWRDGRPIRTRDGGLVALPNLDPAAGTFPKMPGLARVRISGSSATDLCRVADGSLAAFVCTDRPAVHAHDLAAAYAVILEAGGVVIDAGGVPPILVPDPKPCMHFVAAASLGLARSLLGAQAQMQTAATRV